ncbi:MAG: bifunctional ornithine acetyltransferase/N-acetylglutamate synthase, partial [Candidatus Latescibacterota bacterium]
MRDIPGGITAPHGFSAGTAECGIKHPGRPDLVIIASDSPAVCAGVFTTNRIKGAPVIVSRENVRSGKARAIIANSGNANTCNGEEGIAAAMTMTGQTAFYLGCDPSEVLIASTGVIGRLFPIDRVTAGIPKAVAGLSRANG